jgi:hypothetical protein
MNFLIEALSQFCIACAPNLIFSLLPKSASRSPKFSCTALLNHLIAQNQQWAPCRAVRHSVGMG